MKKISYFLAVYLMLGFIFIGCSDHDDIITPEVVGPEGEVVIPEEEAVVLNDPINDFVWGGMNSWYNWQTDVPNLADTKNDDLDSYYTYLNEYTNPETLFESLLFDAGNTDRFSWFIDDYVEQNNAFQGITTSFGFRLQAVVINDVGDIVFYVRYVAHNSPSSDAGIKRGDIINALNGVVLNESNYSSAVSGLYNETLTMSFVSESDGVLTFIEDKTITAIELAEDPVHFKTVFNDINGRKVGYLVYNSFRSSYNDELNAAFSYFQGEGIDELVLDLRLNGGGSVLTSAYLASMIYANAGTDTFADLKFNSKHSAENGSYDFYNTLAIYDSSGNNIGSEAISRLSTLDKLYVLTSSSTASASEMIINGLKPFITVKVIGTTTYGKNVGSITLYDSPTSEYTNINTANSAHVNAMQPIVFQIYNKLGESDYTQGFVPDIEVKEWSSWNAILPFGDENEEVLKAALDDIRGVSARRAPSKYENSRKFDVTQLENKFEKEMYIDSDFFNK